MCAAPTKSNLMAAKKSLELSGVGYDLLDRKRNILIREMMQLLDLASGLQQKIDSTYSAAYKALEMAQMTLGSCDTFAHTVPQENGLTVSVRSVMGVELPSVELEESGEDVIPFGLATSNSRLDEAYARFLEVKRLTVRLAEVETSVYRLADAIKRTQKRANALKNILIPKFSGEIKSISDALDEKDREEFSRLKVIKRQKDSGNA